MKASELLCQLSKEIVKEIGHGATSEYLVQDVYNILLHGILDNGFRLTNGDSSDTKRDSE